MSTNTSDRNIGEEHGADRGGGAPVELADVSKVFHSKRGTVHALQQTDVRMPAGSFTAMVGPSGCGKSTMLNLVAGLDRPSSGTVEIAGEVVTRPYPDLGVVFQRDLLLEWRNILDNVLLQADMRGQPRAAYKERAIELLSMVGLDQFLDRQPSELSGGMRQRASICRALVHRPSVLLMDEPFGALDAITRDQLNIDLSGICAKASTTTLFITHSVAEAVFLADQVVVMSARPGRVIGIIPVDEPTPRDYEFRQSDRFAETVKSVRALLHNEGVI